MIDKISKEDVKKILPRTSTRATPTSSIPKIPMSEDQGDGPTKAELAIEKQPKEKSTKKQKFQKQVEDNQPSETKGKDTVEGSMPKGKEKAKNSERKEKEKHEEMKLKKKKIELDQLGMTERTERRTQRELIDEKSQVPVKISQAAETQVEVEDEEFQPAEPPPRRKMHISSKVKRLFTKIIQGKQPIKDRALDLEIFVIDM